MYKSKKDFYFKLIFTISLVSIISAYFIEYVLGHQPCNLCLIERFPYVLSVILITLNYISKKYEKFMVILLTLIFIISFLVSFYHFGIEQGFFEESVVCGSKNTSGVLTKEELLKQLEVKTINCKDVTFKIFGFSLTTLNIFINSILIIMLFKIFKNYEIIKK